MNMFDFSNIKIKEKSFKDYNILNSRFDFKDNLRLLILTIKIHSKKREINTDDILESFNNSKFSFSYLGYVYDININFGASINPNSGIANGWNVHLYVYNIIREDIQEGKFKFSLFNISDKILQDFKGYPDGGFSNSLLLFNIGNIPWKLEDIHFLEKKDRSNFIQNGVLINNKSLNYLDVKSQMFYICRIISFITRKDVCCMESFDENGVLIETFEYKAKPFGGDTEIINIFAHSSISKFISQGYAVYKQDEDWWLLTLNYFKETRFANALESKMLLACILLERISKKFLSPIKGIIDSSLSEKKDDILKLFNSELSKILDHWDEKRSENLFNIIKGWDSSRSLSVAIEELSKEYQVPKLFKELPAFRGALAHNGVWGKNIDVYKASLAYQELDLFLIILILRKLGYKGKFTHDFIQNREMVFLDMKDLNNKKNLSDFNDMRIG